MSADRVALREYRDEDYQACESLVANVWEFDRHFRPQAFADIAKFVYTMGSVASSNFRMVAVCDDRVSGFIFGNNEKKPLERHALHGLRANLAILGRILLIKGMSFRSKWTFIRSLGIHEKNRTALLERGKSEIVLFVVHPDFQGRGLGKDLFGSFRAYCAAAGVGSIIVETNKAGAASFYERIGFHLKGDFDSPLHRYATPDGQACLYEYVL